MTYRSRTSGCFDTELTLCFCCLLLLLLLLLLLWAVCCPLLCFVMNTSISHTIKVPEPTCLLASSWDEADGATLFAGFNRLSACARMDSSRIAGPLLKPAAQHRLGVENRQFDRAIIVCTHLLVVSSCSPIGQEEVCLSVYEGIL